MNEGYNKTDAQAINILSIPWAELPPTYESVYHYTSKTALEQIAKNGLRHFSERDKASDQDIVLQHRLAFDQKCDTIAKQSGYDFQRSKSVFLALSSDIDSANWERFGEVKLEVKVDSSQARVFDRQLHSYAAIAFYKTAEGKVWLESDYPPGSEQRKELDRLLETKILHSWEDYLQKYFQESLSLVDYLKRSEEDRKLLQVPEVMVPSPVNPKFIRIALNQ